MLHNWDGIRARLVHIGQRAIAIVGVDDIPARTARHAILVRGRGSRGAFCLARRRPRRRCAKHDDDPSMTTTTTNRRRRRDSGGGGVVLCRSLYQ